MADKKKPVSLQEAFRLPPEEAVAYFKSKGYKISFDWRQVWQEEHDKVFTVAGVARDDVLFDIRKHLSTALKEGWSQKRFMDTLTPRLKEKGWWGSEVIVDEDGNSRVYQKGSASRLDLIFRQNVQRRREVAASTGSKKRTPVPYLFGHSRRPYSPDAPGARRQDLPYRRSLLACILPAEWLPVTLQRVFFLPAGG